MARGAQSKSPKALDAFRPSISGAGSTIIVNVIIKFSILRSLSWTFELVACGKPHGSDSLRLPCELADVRVTRLGQS